MKYAIFGAGVFGERYYNLLKDKLDIVCFIDNNRIKHGTKYMGLDVIDPQIAAESGFAVIHAIKKTPWAQIFKQLFDVGIKVLCVVESSSPVKLSFYDFSQFPVPGKNKKKICVMRNEYSVTSANIVRDNPYDDIEIVLVSSQVKDSLFDYHCITSDLIITQMLEDLQFLGSDKKIIELWHGFTIKTLFCMNKDRQERERLDEIFKIMSQRDAFCSLSKLYSVFFGYCSNLSYDKFRITGYPRNDLLIKSDGKTSMRMLFGHGKKYAVIYMPTYRQRESSALINVNNGENTFLFDAPGFDLRNFGQYLAQNDIMFILKMHSIQVDEKKVEETENIRILTDAMLEERGMDLYEVLGGTDCLISDYSSVIIDYLLTDKPMIFAPTDLKAYEENRGLMIEPYDAWMPGAIALTYGQLIAAIDNALFGDDMYKTDRERLRRITHKHMDGNSSLRVLALARELMGMEQTPV